MYTAAALTGILASGPAQPTIGPNVELAKAYGYAMIKAQKKDATLRDTRAKQK